MSKNISRLSFLFLAIGVIIVVTVLVSIQKSATANVKNSPNPLLAGDPIVLYQYVSSLGETEKKEVYGKLVSRDKSAIWKIHMSAYLAGHPELNEEQQGVILEAISLATPKYFDIPVHALDSETEMDKKVAMLRLRALSVFRKGEAGVIFASLNGSTANPTSSQITGLRKIDSCNCNRGNDWCWNTCQNTGCNGSNGGCGWWLGYPCNGECS